MTTSPTMSMLHTVLGDDPLTPRELGYFHSRFQNKAHNCILETFDDEANARGINQVYLSRKSGMRPEVVSRLLTAPGNLTLNTYATLMLSMGYDPEIGAHPLRDSHPAATNQIHPLFASHTANAAPYSAFQAGGGSTANVVTVIFPQENPTAKSDA